MRNNEKNSNRNQDFSNRCCQGSEAKNSTVKNSKSNEKRSDACSSQSMNKK